MVSDSERKVNSPFLTGVTQLRPMKKRPHNMKVITDQSSEGNQPSTALGSPHFGRTIDKYHLNPLN